MTIPRSYGKRAASARSGSQRAGVDTVLVNTTSEGILITPYREPKIPSWAKEDA